MAEVTIGQNDYPAFVEVEEADEFLAADVLRAARWAARSADDRARGIVSATRLLLGLPWCAPVPDPADDETVPQAVRNVTAELAADLLAKPKLLADASGNSNIKSAGAGPARVEFFGPVSSGRPIPQAMWATLERAGLLCGGQVTGSGNDGPYVSGIWDGTRPLEGRYADYGHPGYYAEDCD